MVRSLPLLAAVPLWFVTVSFVLVGIWRALTVRMLVLGPPQYLLRSSSFPPTHWTSSMPPTLLSTSRSSLEKVLVISSSSFAGSVSTGLEGGARKWCKEVVRTSK